MVEIFKEQAAFDIAAKIDDTPLPAAVMAIGTRKSGKTNLLLDVAFQTDKKCRRVAADDIARLHATKADGAVLRDWVNKDIDAEIVSAIKRDKVVLIDDTHETIAKRRARIMHLRNDLGVTMIGGVFLDFDLEHLIENRDNGGYSTPTDEILQRWHSDLSAQRPSRGEGFDWLAIVDDQGTRFSTE